eukprot:1151450-Pelagomonas_calceolata.AAC.6
MSSPTVRKSSRFNEQFERTFACRRGAGKGVMSEQGGEQQQQQQRPTPPPRGDFQLSFHRFLKKEPDLEDPKVKEEELALLLDLCVKAVEAAA